MAERTQESQVDIIELNISCPMQSSGVNFGTSCDSVAQVTTGVKNRTKAYYGDTKRYKHRRYGDVLMQLPMHCHINTLTGMRIDIRTRRPILRNNTGGLSGPAVFPIAVRMVSEVAKRVSIPIVGIGGIASWEDAAEMMIAGANAIQVGTANFHDPFACVKIIDGLKNFADSLGLKSITELTGTLKEW